MVCNVCGTSDATVHLTEIINNQMLEIHLCEACAQEKGTDFKTHFNWSELMPGLASAGKTAKGQESRTSVRCGECGMSYEDFAKTGRLGCGNCYTAFAKMLLPLIKRVHHAVHHVGKKPSKIPRTVRNTHDLRLLQDRLRKSVQMEAFEEAAKLRDEIKQLEEKTKRGKTNKSE
ncbi:MAG TPA: excinuclease ABC subunit B [bacterium]|nr:excinuclease ABC subunit B [bacterium]